MTLASARVRGRAKAARTRGSRLVTLALVTCAAGCATVRPEQRAILADSIMRFGSADRASALRDHVLGSREGSIGGSV